MHNFYELALGRRSIRKYEDKDIPLEEIQEIIRIATSAPSGCNSQCWKFVAIKDKSVIKELQNAAVLSIEQLLEPELNELPEQYLASKRKMVSFFAKAPVVIAVFMTSLTYYDPVMISVLEKKGYSHDKMMEFFAYPDLLSIGAAVQNLLLAVHEKGYGACWMNEPSIAGKRINSILGESEDSKFISLIPIGVPAYIPIDKKMKPFQEVYKEI